MDSADSDDMFLLSFAIDVEPATDTPTAAQPFLGDTIPELAAAFRAAVTKRNSADVARLCGALGSMAQARSAGPELLVEGAIDSLASAVALCASSSEHLAAGCWSWRPQPCTSYRERSVVGAVAALQVGSSWT